MTVDRFYWAPGADPVGSIRIGHFEERITPDLKDPYKADIVIRYGQRFAHDTEQLALQDTDALAIEGLI